MELLKLLSANEITAQVISFLLLLFLLRRFGWGPFLKALDDRRERISSELKRIDETKAELAVIREEYEKNLKDIEEAAMRRTEEAVSEGKKMAEALKESAKEEAQKIMSSTSHAIKSELDKAKEELKGEIVNLTVSVAEKVIQEKLTEREDKRLIEDFLKGMDKIQ